MNETEVPAHAYKIEKAHIDWLKTRYQLVIAMLGIFCLCLANFMFFAKWTESVDSIVPAVLSFILYSGSCFLVAFITLELTGRFGNRIGAGSSLWSTLLFCLSPLQLELCSPTKIIERAISFFFLAAALLLLRARVTYWLIVLMVIFLCLEIYAYLYVDQDLGKSCIHYLKNTCLFFSLTNKANIDMLLLLAYVITGSVCLLRVFLGNLNSRAWVILANCLMTTIILANLPILYKIWNQKYWIFLNGFIVLAYASLVIVLSLACLPAIDKGRIRSIYMTGFCGLVALVIFSIVFEILFTSI